MITACSKAGSAAWTTAEKAATTRRRCGKRPQAASTRERASSRSLSAEKSRNHAASTPKRTVIPSPLRGEGTRRGTPPNEAPPPNQLPRKPRPPLLNPLPAGERRSVCRNSGSFPRPPQSVCRSPGSFPRPPQPVCRSSRLFFPTPANREHPLPTLRKKASHRIAPPNPKTLKLHGSGVPKPSRQGMKREAGAW